MKIKILLKTKQLGSTLLTTLFICSLLGVSVMGYLSLVEYQNRLSFRSQTWNLTISLVEAGIEEGLTHLNAHYDNLNQDGWIYEGNDLYSLERTLLTGSYRVVVDATDIQYPLVTARATVNMTPTAQNRFSSLLAAIGVDANAGSQTVSRAVLVHTYRGKLFTKAMVAKNTIDMKGNNVRTDSFDSTDPLYSNPDGTYNPSMFKAEGDVASNTNIVGAIDVGNANIYGHVATGPGGTVKVGSQGAVGNAEWQASNTGIQDGWVSDASNFTFPDTSFPYSSGFPPEANKTVITIVSISTNSTAVSNSTVYPSPVPPSGVITNTSWVTLTSPTNPPPPGLVTNNSLVTASSLPSPLPGGTITTNTTSTTGSYPGYGTYLGSVQTNTTSTTTDAYPAAGTYVGMVTTNYQGNSSTIKNYTYARVTNFTYNRISSYTYTTTVYQYPTYLYSWVEYDENIVYSTNTYDHVLYSGDYYYSGDLDGSILIVGNARLVLPAGLDMSGNNDTLKVAKGASLEMWVGGTSVTLSGNAGMNETGLAQNLIVYCADTVTSLNIAGNADFVGVLVAPNANVSLNGSGNPADPTDFTGSLLANSITLNGHFNFHYDEALKKLPPNGRYLITRWDEIAD